MGTTLIVTIRSAPVAKTSKGDLVIHALTGLIFILKNMGWQDNKTITYAPPNRLEAAKTPEQIAEVIQQDIVD